MFLGDVIAVATHPVDRDDDVANFQPDEVCRRVAPNGRDRESDDREM